MSTETQELLSICEALSPNKREELADFARYLLARQDEERWEQLLASPQRRPKLEAFLQESAKESASPLDQSRL